jgi:acetoin utilization protein AcuB
MLVRARMTPDPITVHPETSYDDALSLLREHKIRRLPVVDNQGHLVGMVVEKDLLYASPSPATTLSVFEIHYLLSKLQVKEIMTKRVITVEEECPLEEAARIMVDQKIGSLPIMRGNQLVGIITETDIFAIMAEALGGRSKGLRVSLRCADAKGELAALTAEIARQGGNIISLVTFWGDSPAKREITFKIEEVDRDEMIAGLKKTGAEILDVREVGEEYRPVLYTSGK